MSLQSTLSNKAINRAGRVLVRADADPAEREGALQAVNEWRGSFFFPLRVISGWLEHSSKRVNEKALVSRRLKRMESIVTKLGRPGGVKNLSTMQDIGGCRVILPTLADVVLLQEQNTSLRDSGTFSSIDDYISIPKPDGYRSLHVVAPYRSGNPKYAAWSGRKIEVQVRTSLQHAWATAVETVDLFSGQQLKIGGGDQQWRRFFALASSVFALEEGAPLVPGTPTDKDFLKKELADLWESLHVVDVMNGWAFAINYLPNLLSARHVSGADLSIFLITVDVDVQRLQVNAYSQDELAIADHRYSLLEEEIRNGRKSHTVLVAVDELKNLREAYPNFYADTTDFIQRIGQFIDSYPGRAILQSWEPSRNPRGT
jgi:hypothetical protein